MTPDPEDFEPDEEETDIDAGCEYCHALHCAGSCQDEDW